MYIVKEELKIEIAWLQNEKKELEKRRKYLEGRFTSKEQSHAECEKNTLSW